MEYSELVSYIAEQTQEGMSAEGLRVVLMEAGWRDAEIDNALHDVAAGLKPATPGVSIHADLAQVRGMVAHLADRVRVLEGRLTDAPLPELPSGFTGPERELSAPYHGSPIFRHIVSFLMAVGAFILLDMYVPGLAIFDGWMPGDVLTVTGAIGGGMLIGGYVLMRLRRAWAASLVTGIASGVLLAVTWGARGEHLIETSTAIALTVLLLVLWVVIGRWTDRLAGR